MESILRETNEPEHVPDWAVHMTCTTMHAAILVIEVAENADTSTEEGAIDEEEMNWALATWVGLQEAGQAPDSAENRCDREASSRSGAGYAEACEEYPVLQLPELGTPREGLPSSQAEAGAGSKRSRERWQELLRGVA